MSAAHVRGGIAPEPSEPTTTSFLTPPALADLDRARPPEGVVLDGALRRALRERRHPGAARGRFENKI